VAIVEGPNNRDLSNRFIEEVINGRKLSLIDETVAEDFVYIDSTIGTVKGRDSLKEMLTRMFSSFPDLVWTVEQYISEGDTIVTHYSVTGTQDGEYRSIPAMHKKITVQGVSINKIIDGKLAETRMLRDDLGLMRQLGVIPE
jgi:Predicted ester cyclase